MPHFVIACIAIAIICCQVYALNHYNILGVPRGATEADIKKAYRKLSLLYHPDKNSAKDASDRFSEIGAAYEVLSDSRKRRAYDLGGDDGLKNEERRQNRGDRSGSFGFGDPRQQHRNQHQQRHQHQHQEIKRPKSPNAVIPLVLSLKQLFMGEKLDAVYNRQVLCANAKYCERPDGACIAAGIRLVMQRVGNGRAQQVQIKDGGCLGRGRSWNVRCTACPRGMTHPQDHKIVVEVPPGANEGEQIRFTGVSDALPGHDPGDLVFTIKQEPHKVFTRKGDDLHVGLTIPLVDALVGFRTTIQTVDGRLLPIEKRSVTRWAEILKISGEGMPRRAKSPDGLMRYSGKRGHLYVTFFIDFPTQLTPQQRESIFHTLGRPDSPPRFTKVQ